MANSLTHHDPHARASGPERLELGESAWPLYWTSTIVGVTGILLAVLVGALKTSGLAHFFFAYLIAFCFVLSLALGALFFVLLQYLTKAGWSVNVRRIAEWMASSMPVVAAMSAPLLIAVLLHNGVPYRWSDPNWGKPEAENVAANAAPAATHPKAEGALKTEEISASKRMYLSPIAFVARVIAYFAIWSIIAVWYWKQSVLQDKTGDSRLTARMQSLAAPALVVCALSLTLASFDLIMSLDPTWASTMFGVYYFAGSMLAFFAFAIIAVVYLQSKGFLTRGITVEHIHDMGKFLFAFTFFFGYIAFSQYMLMWYANIPEETEWFLRRGVSTEPGAQNGYTIFALAILFGKVLIPFAGLLSRHVKRNPKLLAFWACWILFFHWCDLYWLIEPEMDGFLHLGLLQVFTTVGLLGLFVATVVRKAAHESLRPLHDPREGEALAFHNI
jgi:hypothetical protein